MAVLSFASEEMACDWLKLTPEISNENWLGSCDIVMIQSDESFQECTANIVTSK